MKVKNTIKIRYYEKKGNKRRNSIEERILQKRRKIIADINRWKCGGECVLFQL
jgi:hypothetical protein